MPAINTPPLGYDGWQERDLSVSLRANGRVDVLTDVSDDKTEVVIAQNMSIKGLIFYAAARGGY